MHSNRFAAIYSGTGALMAALMVAFCPGSLSRAQTATPEARTEGIEEIVVTATRRSEALSKVPISVTAKIRMRSMNEASRISRIWFAILRA